MSEWQSIQLGELCDPIRGITYGIVKVGEYVSGGVPVIRGGDIRDNRIVFSDAKRVSVEISNQFSRTILRGGEIVLNLIAEPGHSAVVPASMAGYNVSRDVAAIALKGQVNSQFVNFFLRSPIAIQWLAARLQGSVTQKINLGTLRQMPVSIPPRRYQDAMAMTLGALEDKISANDRIVMTIDQLGKASLSDFFKSALGQVSRGEKFTAQWHVRKLGELVSVLETGRRPKGGVGAYRTGIPSIGAESITRLATFDFTKAKYVPTEYFESMSQGIIQSHDILLYKDGGRPGNFEPHVTLFGSGYPFDQMCINEHVYRIRMADPIRQEFGYFWLSSEPIMAEMRSRGTGVAVPGLNSAAVKELPIIVPPDDLNQRFNAIAVPLVESALSVAKETYALSLIRNMLLPKLMSGQIRVQEAERIVEDVT